LKEKKNMAKVKQESKPRLIKILIDSEEHMRLRLAAAMMDQGLSEFCRATVVEKVMDLTKDVKLPKKISKAEATQ
jgi:hypothetical protein